ncbi:MAG: hypothetical protein HOP19_06950 [Acidobacteria bacterium]|nr:hypothetical protein [Acidobacteriota bacterium]
MISQLTIELPINVAQQLATLAAQQQKSVEALAVEKLAASLDPLPTYERGSPAAILQAMDSLPRLNAEDADEMERLINEGRLPISEVGIFDDEIEK